MKNNSIHLRLGRLLAWCAGLTFVALTAGCGGSEGAGAQGGAGGTSSASTASALQLFTDKPTLKADGSQTATLTAVVKDANNNVVPRQAVAFTTTDAGSALTPGATPLVTDESGKATATLAVGATHLNRVVTVTATAGNISQTVSIPVTGTTVSVAGAPTIAQGSSSAYVVTLRDGSSNALPGVPVTLASARGNGIAPATANTDSTGQASFTVTGSASGSDTLSATALGATGQFTVNVAAATAVSGISVSPATANVPINTPTALTATYLIGSVPQAGKTLTLSLTRGSFTSNGLTTLSGTTNASGQLQVSVTSPTAGTSSLTALDAGDPSVTGTSTLQFFSGPANAAKITLATSSTSVGVNPPGSSTNKSTLIAVVRDASDNPISGATVSFSAIADPSGGSVSPATVVTDSTGTAQSSFIPGGSSTGPNGVQLRAVVATNTAIAATASLTVDNVAYFVDLGTGNTIEAPSATQYKMPWTANVTDSSGKAVSGAQVSVSLTAVRYFKGVWVYSGGAWGPAGLANAGSSPSGPPGVCRNEDLNRNNILDGGEDKNGNGKLEPGSPATVAVLSATDANGFAPIEITYAKSFGNWVEVTLKATISTPGTESFIERTFVLPVLSSDVTTATTSPPSVGTRVNGSGPLTGPYGWDASVDGDGYCTVAN